MCPFPVTGPARVEFLPWSAYDAALQYYKRRRIICPLSLICNAYNEFGIIGSFAPFVPMRSLSTARPLARTPAPLRSVSATPSHSCSLRSKVTRRRCRSLLATPGELHSPASVRLLRRGDTGLTFGALLRYKLKRVIQNSTFISAQCRK